MGFDQSSPVQLNPEKKNLTDLKNPFFSPKKSYNLIYIYIFFPKKICYPLIFPILGGPIRPELSSTACFRIQGVGSPERDGRTNKQMKEILVSNIV